MKIVAGIVIVIIGIVAYYKLAYPDYTYRYRMTVEVNTPEGLKSGSSVIEVTTSQIPEWLSGLFGGHSQGSKAVGEAPFVDLGERGILFTALKYDYTRRIYPRIYTGKGHGARKSGGVPDYATATDYSAILPVKEYPLLVKFGDITDPMTVTEVKPDDLAASFGKGVILKNIIIERTNKASQARIGGVLGWLPQYHNQLFDGRKIHTIEAQNKLANSLGAGAFSFHKIK